MTAREFLREVEVRIGVKNGMPAVEIGSYPTQRSGVGRIDDTAQRKLLEEETALIPGKIRFTE